LSPLDLTYCDYNVSTDLQIVVYIPTLKVGGTVPHCPPIRPCLYSLLSLTETTCLLLTYVLSLGVNAVDHIVALSP